jgi:hypothetical protein
VRDVLGFKSENYSSIQIETQEDFARLVHGTKRALVRGIAVPLAFPVNFDQLKLDTFTGDGANEETNFHRDGAHAVLITDWVNKDGHEGALESSAISIELEKSEEDLAHFIIKNSWGINATKNESGKGISGSETGYYKIDRSYLKSSAKQVLGEPAMRDLLNVLLPKDIVLAPFDDEPVNPKVAK